MGIEMDDERTVMVPGPDEDCLDYVATLFELQEGEVPADAIIVIGYLGEIDPDDPASSGQYWQMRTTGEGISSTHIGLMAMAMHRLNHIANREDGD